MEALDDTYYPDVAEVTAKGISYRGNFYSCSAAIREQWFLRANDKTVLVTVFMDNSDDDYLFVNWKTIV